MANLSVPKARAYTRLVNNKPVIDDVFAADGIVVRHQRTAMPSLLAIYAFGSRVQGTAGLADIAKDGRVYGR